MVRDSYCSALLRLPILNPTAGDMAAVCPHLSPEEAVRTFKSSRYVACPPLYVRGAYQVVEYTEAHEGDEYKVNERGWPVRTGRRVMYPAKLSLGFSGRTFDSFADGNAPTSVFIHHSHHLKAIRFAELHWQDQLVSDTWRSVGRVIVQDFDSASGSLTTKFVLHVALRRELNDMFNDLSASRGEVIDSAIVAIESEDLHGTEMKADGRGEWVNFNCAHSGCVLRPNNPQSCGRIPLTPRMIKYLQELGHTFKVDPMIAVVEERRAWDAETGRA